MKYIDITRTLNSSVECWPGDRPFKLNTGDTSSSDGFCTSDIEGSVHIGTHIDAPRHCISGGKAADEIDLHKLIGPARVLTPTGSGEIISASHLGTIADGTKKLLLNNSANRGLDLSAAQKLIDLGVELIATESASIAADHCELCVHELLLSREIVIIESVDLSSAQDGVYNLICLPVKLSNSDGAWVRAILS